MYHCSIFSFYTYFIYFIYFYFALLYFLYKYFHPKKDSLFRSFFRHCQKRTNSLTHLPEKVGHKSLIMTCSIYEKKPLFPRKTRKDLNIILNPEETFVFSKTGRNLTNSLKTRKNLCLLDRSEGISLIPSKPEETFVSSKTRRIYPFPQNPEGISLQLSTRVCFVDSQAKWIPSWSFSLC